MRASRCNATTRFEMHTTVHIDFHLLSWSFRRLIYAQLKSFSLIQFLSIHFRAFFAQHCERKHSDKYANEWNAFAFWFNLWQCYRQMASKLIAAHTKATHLQPNLSCHNSLLLHSRIRIYLCAARAHLFVCAVCGCRATTVTFRFVFFSFAGAYFSLFHSCYHPKSF